MKLTKSQLDKLLSEVTGDVEELLKSESEESSLSKADEGEEAPAEKEPEGSSTEQPADEENEASTEGGAAGPEASASPDGQETAPEGQDGQDPAADAEATPEALEAEYSKLDVEGLKMHFLACKSALMKALAGPDGDAGGPDAGGDPGADQGAPPQGGPPQEEAPPVMGKSEKEILTRLTKAEAVVAEVETLKKSIKDKDDTIKALEDNIGKVAAGFQKLITSGQVMRKSVQGIGFMAKPGTEVAAPGEVDVSSLSKSDVIRKLNTVTSSMTLAKSDRETINRFVLGTGSVESIAKYLK